MRFLLITCLLSTDDWTHRVSYNSFLQSRSLVSLFPQKFWSLAVGQRHWFMHEVSMKFGLMETILTNLSASEFFNWWGGGQKIHSVTCYSTTAFVNSLQSLHRPKFAFGSCEGDHVSWSNEIWGDWRCPPSFQQVTSPSVTVSLKRGFIMSFFCYSICYTNTLLLLDGCLIHRLV